MTTCTDGPHRGIDNAYGDLKERREKMDAKFDSSAALGVMNWIESVIGEPVENKDDMTTALHDGIVLCKLMNKLKPDSIKKTYTGTLAFKQMENIGQFLTSLPPYGVRSEDLFETPDLYEGTNMASVLVCLGQVKRVQAKHDNGETVEPQEVRQSAALKTCRVKNEPVRANKQWKNTGATKSKYEHAGKDIANAANPEDAQDGLYGDRAERKKQLDMKYDTKLEAKIREWIEAKTGESIGDDFQEGLKSGVILLNLMGKLGHEVKVNVKKMPFAERENIDNFLIAAEQFGVISSDKFNVNDLYEASNMSQVLMCIDAVKRKAESKGL